MQPSPSSSILPKKWAPASSVVESRSKARELSRALERAEADLKAIDRQFQLLDSGLLSEEELRKFAGKSFFGPDDATSPPPRHRYLDAANTRARRREQAQHRQRRQRNEAQHHVQHSHRSATFEESALSRKPHRVSPLQSSSAYPSPSASPSSFAATTAATDDNGGRSRPHSPYAAAKTPSMVGVRIAMDDIRSSSRGRKRDGRVEHDSTLNIEQRRLRDRQRASPVGGFVGRGGRRPETQTTSPNEEKRERRRMLKEDRLSLAARDASIRRRRALDRELFVAYAARFGPLDGVLFATSDLPGLLYEKIVADAAIVVARWWRAIWPQRALAKHKASTFIQTMYRGSRGRRAVKGERNTRRAISHLFNRIAASSFNRWRVQARQSRRMRDLMRRVVHGAILNCFNMWRADVAAIRETRRRKMQPILNRVLNRLLVFTFFPWKKEWEKAMRLKALMRKSLAGRKQYCFEHWQDSAKWLKDERKAASQRRFTAVIDIQRVVRGHIARHCATGGLARRRAEKLREAKERRREKKRKAEYDRMVCAIASEVKRGEREAAFVLSAVEGALEELHDGWKGRNGRRALNLKAAQYQGRVSQQQPQLKITLKMAREAVVMRDEEDLRRRVADRALRQFRVSSPPVVSCPDCRTGFGHRKDRDRHICQPEITRARRRGSISTHTESGGSEGADVRKEKMTLSYVLAKRDPLADTDSTRPLFEYLGARGTSSTEENDKNDSAAQKDENDKIDTAASPKKSMYQRLFGFYQKSRLRGAAEAQQQEREIQNRRDAWEKVKSQDYAMEDSDDQMRWAASRGGTSAPEPSSTENEEQKDKGTSTEKDSASNKPSLLSYIFGALSSTISSKKTSPDGGKSSGDRRFPSEKVQVESMSEMIAQLQMIKTRLLMTDSHAGGRKIDRQLRVIDARAKRVLKPLWQENISHLVSRYLHELDELMYTVVAKGGEKWDDVQKDRSLRSHKSQDVLGPRAQRRLLGLVEEGTNAKDLFKLALPRIIHQRARLDQERPLAHMAHSMRGVEFEVSIYGHGESLGYMLTFECHGGARKSTYRLTCSLDQCLSLLTAEEVQYLLEHEDLLALTVQDMMRVYVSLNAIRMYVACLVLKVPTKRRRVRKQISMAEFNARAAERQSFSAESNHTEGRGTSGDSAKLDDNNEVADEEAFTSDEESVITVVTTESVEEETLALESQFVLALDREAAEVESGSILEQRAIAERQAASDGGNALPVIVRRSSAAGSGRNLLHLKADLLGVPHQISVTHSEFDVTFVCVNNLGLEKRLRIEVAECAALLHPNEVADLMRYVKARHPNINMESPSSMIRVWTCELALRRYVTFLALELPEIGNDDDDDVVTEGEIEDGEEEEETRPLIQGGQEEMLLVLRRAPPRKVVKSSESEDNDDCRQSQDPAMSLVHAEVERAEAEADALASEKVARSAVVVAVHAAQAACEGLNVNFIKSRAPSATTARTKSTKRKVPGQKLKVADSLLKRDRNHITSLLERSATIARMSNALYSGISTCGDLDVDVEHLDVHQDDKDTTNLDSDVASLEFCRWVVHASLRSKTQPIAQYTVEMSQQEAEQSLRGLVGVGNNRNSAIDSRAVAARDPAVFASEIGSRVWLCDLGRRRPWVPRLVLAPRVSLAREQLVRAPSDVAQHEICERESKDESQYSQTRAEGEARMSSLTKISAVFMKKDVNIPTDKDSILPCGDVVVCRHVQTNRWIFCVNHVSGDGGVYQLECTEARCLSLLANVSMSLTNEDADDSFGQSVAEILRALGAGSALCAMPSFSRPGTAGGDAADGREGVGLAPFITEEERRTGIARSDQGLEGVRERLAEIIVEKCLMLRTIDLTARPSFPSATGDDDVAESNLSGALQGAATAHARMALSVVPIVCAAATSMSQATQDDETEQSDLLASELSLSGDPDNVATHATESSFSISGMILAHSMARKLVARKRVVFYAPRIRIGRAHYSVKILRKEVQTEKDTSLYMANVGTVLLEIEVVDMRNRVWKLVENEDECLILVEDAILARMSEHISYSRSTPELTECHPNFKQLGRVADKGVVEESLLAPVLHAPRRASRRAYALIAQRLVFTKHQHRSHMTDDQRGRRKGSRLVLSLHRGSVTKMKEIAECVTADWLHEERHAWRGKLPKTRPVKEMVVMMSPEQRERVRAKERELYEKRLRAFQTETSALDYHLEYALEVTSHLGGETTMLQADGGEDQDEDLFGESSSAKMVEMQGWKWEDETATVAMRNLHSCEYSGREAQYVKFAAACPEHFFGVRRKPDVLGVPRFGAMVHGEHIGEYASEIDAAIAVDHFRLRLQPDLDKTQLNFSDAKVLPAPKNLLSDY